MLLLKDGKIIHDDWHKIDQSNVDVFPKGPLLFPYQSFLSFLEEREISQPLGLIFPCDLDIELLQPVLHHLALIALEFPNFTDGRAFSQARKLRESLKFTGDIRATGYYLPDQYLFLKRTGFSTVEIPDSADLTLWQKSLHEFTDAYQPSILEEILESGLRRKL